MEVSSLGGNLLQDSSLNRASITQDDFLRVFMAQLQFQDPLKPVDNQEFMAQMAQFSALDQSRQTNEKIDALLTMQSAAQSVGLLGKNVEVAAQSGTALGEVTAVSYRSGAPELTVTTSDGEVILGVTLSQIALVRD